MALTREEFEQLYRAHAPEVLGYLKRRGAGQDAQDILAETFLVAWRRRQQLVDPDQRRAWLFGTTRRLLLAARRTTIPRPVSEPEPQPAPNPDSCAERASDRLVRKVLADLPELDRELLTMTAWENLTVAEAGRVLGLKPAAARVRLHRARRRLAADPRLVALIAAPVEQSDPCPVRGEPPTPSSSYAPRLVIASKE